MKQIVEATIQPLTAIHVGSGNSLTPMEYLVKPIKDIPMYLAFDSSSILNRICTDKAKLREYELVNNQGNMIHSQKFLAENFSIREDLAYPCETTEGFQRDARNNAGKDPLDNAQEVLQMYRPEGKMSPVIPGSSLKGSIRTAVLNQAIHDWDNDKYNRYCDKIQQAKSTFKVQDAKRIEGEIQDDVMGRDPKNDIFRTVSCGDASFSSKGTQMVGCVLNIVKQEYNDTIEAKGIPIRAEVLKGSLMGNEMVGTSRIAIDTDLQRIQFRGDRSRYASIDAIAKACNYFFQREFKREAEKFYDGVDDKRLALYNQLKKMVESVPEDATDRFLVRLGRWSQVEFVTFEPNYRVPKVPENHGYGNTRMVFDYNGQFLPIGWCLCTIRNTQ